MRMSSHFVCDYLENDEERTEGVVVCQNISGNPQLEEEILPRLCPSLPLELRVIDGQVNAKGKSWRLHRPHTR